MATRVGSYFPKAGHSATQTELKYNNQKFRWFFGSHNNPLPRQRIFTVDK